MLSSIVSHSILTSLSLLSHQNWCWNIGRIERHLKRRQTLVEQSLGDSAIVDKKGRESADKGEGYVPRPSYCQELMSPEKIRERASVVAGPAPADITNVCTELFMIEMSVGGYMCKLDVTMQVRKVTTQFCGSEEKSSLLFLTFEKDNWKQLQS